MANAGAIALLAPPPLLCRSTTASDTHTGCNDVGRGSVQRTVCSDRQWSCWRQSPARWPLDWYGARCHGLRRKRRRLWCSESWQPWSTHTSRSLISWSLPMRKSPSSPINFSKTLVLQENSITFTFIWNFVNVKGFWFWYLISPRLITKFRSLNENWKSFVKILLLA